MRLKALVRRIKVLDLTVNFNEYNVVINIKYIHSILPMDAVCAITAVKFYRSSHFEDVTRFP